MSQTLKAFISVSCSSSLQQGNSCYGNLSGLNPFEIQMDSQKGHHMPGQLPPIRIQLTTDICCQICCQNCYFFSKGNCVLFRPHGSPWCYFLLLPFASICFRWVQGSSWDSQAHVGRRGTSPMEPRTKLWMIWMCQTVYICLYNFIIFYRCYIMLYHVIQLCSI